MTDLDTIIERTASHIAQCDYGERWYIHPLKIQWNPDRDEWKHWKDNKFLGHDTLEVILKKTHHPSLKDFYIDQVGEEAAE